MRGGVKAGPLIKITFLKNPKKRMTPKLEGRGLGP